MNGDQPFAGAVDLGRALPPGVETRSYTPALVGARWSDAGDVVIGGPIVPGLNVELVLSRSSARTLCQRVLEQLDETDTPA